MVSLLSDLLLQAGIIFEDYFAEAIIVLLLIVLFVYRNDKKRIKAIFISVALALITGYLLKDIFQIPRPCVAMPSLIQCPPSFSLPSLHAAFSFAFIGATIGTKPFYILFPLVLLIVFTRIYLGVHTFVDILAGLVVGVVAFFIAKEIVLLLK